MVWKCPRCSFKTRSYPAMQKHYYSKHYTPKKGAKTVPKGKSKKTHTYKPMKGRR